MTGSILMKNIKARHMKMSHHVLKSDRKVSKKKKITNSLSFKSAMDYSKGGEIREKSQQGHRQ